MDNRPDNEGTRGQLEKDGQILDLLKTSCNFDAFPCREELNLEDQSRYTQLGLTAAQKIQISGLTQQIPYALAAGAMNQAYVVRFPEGLPHTLTALRQGGFGSMIQDASGQFMGSASFYSMSSQAALLGAFTVISAVTGQYFLSQINGELRQIGTKLNEILEFLYEDKKAELLSEVAFVERVYKNYSSIIQNAAQRTATIGSLQQSQKVAIKDVEFYLNDFDKKLADIKDEKSLNNSAGEVLNSKELLEISLRLYVMSSLLEVYYSQNFDPGCIDFLQNNIQTYIKTCTKRMSRAFNKLEGRLEKKDGDWLKMPLDILGVKPDKSPDDQKVRALLAFSAEIENNSWPITEQEIQFALCSPMKTAEYILDGTGNVYVKKAKRENQNDQR